MKINKTIAEKKYLVINDINIGEVFAFDLQTIKDFWLMVKDDSDLYLVNLVTNTIRPIEEEDYLVPVYRVNAELNIEMVKND